MKKLLLSAFLAVSAAAFGQSYHVGLGFSNYDPPFCAIGEVGGMITDKIYVGGQAIWRTNNAPALAAGLITGFFHSWNDRNYRELTTGFFLKVEQKIYVNNDAWEKNPTVPFGWGVRHYWDDWVYMDFGKCQGQFMLTLGVKFGKPIYR